MKDFKKFGGDYIDNLGEYVRDYINTYKNDVKKVKIIVGCDSENAKTTTKYATTVVFYHEGAGAHFIYYFEKIDRVKDLYTKLWGEIERTFKVAEYLEKELEGTYERIDPLKKLIDVDVDVNPNIMWKSNIVYDAAIGFFSGHGYRVKGKPNAIASSYAADLIVKKRSGKRKERRKQRKK